MNPTQLNHISNFLSQYRIKQINHQTLILASHKAKLLIKYHTANEDDEQIIDIFDKHISLDSEYICPLLHYQQTQEKTTIMAVYQLDQLTLKQSIDNRQQTQQYFTQEEIWILLSSIVNSLIYLQQKDIIYGVLSPNKIFIQEKIRIMDPSAFNINPMNISQLSLHSPEIKLNSSCGGGDNIDFHTSDVYLLGLCILSAASLSHFDNGLTEDMLEQLLGSVQQIYSSDLLHVLRFMLKFQAEERPSFQNIKQYIQNQIQIKQVKQSSADILNTDNEDLIIQPQHLQQLDHQVIDKLQVSEGTIETNQYEKARQKYLYTSRIKKYVKNTNCRTATQQRSIEQLQSIDFRGEKDISLLQKSQLIVQQFKLGQLHNISTVSKKKNKAYEIKNRNSQTSRTVQSIIFQNPPQRYQQNNENLFTGPQLLSLLQKETQMAHEYLKRYKKNTK